MNRTTKPLFGIHDMRMPKQLLSTVLKAAIIKNDVEVGLLTKKTNLKTFLRDNAIFSSNGTTFTAIFRRGYSYYGHKDLGVSYYCFENGELIHDDITASDAIRRIPAGRHFLVPMVTTGHRQRRESPIVEVKPSLNKILSHVNKVYGQMFAKRAQHVYDYAKQIYWDLDPKYAESVKSAAKECEKVIVNGATRQHAEDWLSSIGKQSYGYNSWNFNEEAFINECSTPLGTAKFAKGVIELIDKQQERIDRYV